MRPVSFVMKVLVYYNREKKKGVEWEYELERRGIVRLSEVAR